MKQRTKPMARSTTPMKRTPIRRKAKPRPKSVVERYPDAHGRNFDELPMLLPKDHSKWPPFRKVVSIKAREKYRLQHTRMWCPLCDRPTWQCGELELHHIFAGDARRSDEFCLMILLGRRCHERVQSDPSCYPEVLRAKWRADRENCDWMQCVICHGSMFEFDSLD